MEILNQVLKPEHLAAGLSLDEDDHILYLRDKTGKILKVFWAATASIVAVQHEADQALEWSLSGVEFSMTPMFVCSICGVSLEVRDHYVLGDKLYYCPMCYYRLEKK